MKKILFVFMLLQLLIISRINYSQNVTTIDDINVVVNDTRYKDEKVWKQGITDASGFYIIRNIPVFEHILGKDTVVCSHPLTSTSPAIFTVYVSGKSSLTFDVRSHPLGNCKLEIWAGKKLLYEEDIDTKRWKEISISLPTGTKEIELLHYATGWHYEFLYYHFNK